MCRRGIDARARSGCAARASLVMRSLGIVLVCAAARGDAAATRPGGWGGDHVGKPVPEFTSGRRVPVLPPDGRRADVGREPPRRRRSARPIREPAGPGGAAQVAGAKDAGRRGRAAAGRPATACGSSSGGGARQAGSAVRRVDSAACRRRGKLTPPNAALGQPERSATRCAGCHATGVDSQQADVLRLSLDCFVCHGDVPEKHTNERRPGSSCRRSARDRPRVVTSICAQCHVRTGKSQSTGLPYPNNFVAGDNLFRDFQVDLSDAALQKAESRPTGTCWRTSATWCCSARRTSPACRATTFTSSRAKKHHRVADGDICLQLPRRRRIEEGPQALRGPQHDLRLLRRARS